MREFAKLFYSEAYGQVLIMLDTDSDNEYKPTIFAYVSPIDLGVCCTRLGFKDSDKGWETAENVFGSMTLEQAEKIVKTVFDVLDRAGAQP